MGKTNFYAKMELIDTTAAKDARQETKSNQDFADILLFKNEQKQKEYGTLEEDFFLLDGSKEEMDDDPKDIAYFSKEMSDENGNFSSEQSFELKFSENHTSFGLTFAFAPDHPLQMQITWYDAWDIIQVIRVFDVDQDMYFAQEQVVDYRKVKVEFLKAKPYRYVKVNYVRYGTEIYFGKEGYPIKDASLLEETDTISDKLAINNLSFKLIDEMEDYNPANANGMYNALQKGQILHAYEERDEGTDYLGTFFMSKWSSGNSVVSFAFQDYKGQLDNYMFRNGKVYNGISAKDIIREIMMAAGIESYQVDDDVGDTKLYGYLKIQTCRKALREVLFATGAVIDTTRTEKIRIRKPSRYLGYKIKRDRKFKTDVKNNEYVSDVSVKYKQYTLSSQSKELAKGTYEPGTYTIEFTTPAREYTLSAGTLIDSNDNYITFRVDTKEQVIISGKQYAKEELTVTKSVENMKAGMTRLSKSFSSELANADTAEEIAKRILDYYAMSLSLSIQYVAAGEASGFYGIVENRNREFGNYMAVMEKVKTDLTGGYIANGTLRGIYHYESNGEYTKEIYTGEEATL